MSYCTGCGLQIGDSASCELIKIEIGGRLYERIRFLPAGEVERPEFHRDCPDCGIEPGRVHHAGCEFERCPSCDGQLVECACDYQLLPPGSP